MVTCNCREVIAIKNIAFQVDDALHKRIKLQSTEEDKSIKEYIVALILKDLEEKGFLEEFGKALDEELKK